MQVRRVLPIVVEQRLPLQRNKQWVMDKRVVLTVSVRQ